MILLKVVSRSRSFFLSLCEMIGPGFSAVQVFDGKQYHGEAEPIPPGRDNSALARTELSGQILVFREPLFIDPDWTSNRQTVAVVDSQSPKLLDYVSSTGLLAITCGLSARDTITLSSIDTDCAVINLQRSITCFDGSVAEPQEFPVSYPAPVDNFLLMAAASVLILSGNTNRLCHAVFEPSAQHRIGQAKSM